MFALMNCFQAAVCLEKRGPGLKGGQRPRDKCPAAGGSSTQCGPVERAQEAWVILALPLGSHQQGGHIPLALGT